MNFPQCPVCRGLGRVPDPDALPIPIYADTTPCASPYETKILLKVEVPLIPCQACLATGVSDLVLPTQSSTRKEPTWKTKDDLMRDTTPDPIEPVELEESALFGEIPDAEKPKTFQGGRLKTQPLRVAPTDPTFTSPTEKPPFPVNPDPRSTYGRSEAYKEWWNKLYGNNA